MERKLVFCLILSLVSLTTFCDVIQIQGDFKDGSLEQIEIPLEIQNIRRPNLVGQIKASTAGTPLNSEAQTSLKRDLLAKINDARTLKGLGSLSIDADIQNYFQIWQTQYIEHVNVSILFQTVGYNSAKMYEFQGVSRQLAVESVVKACPECVDNSVASGVGFFLRSDDGLNVHIVVNNVQNSGSIQVAKYNSQQLRALSNLNQNRNQNALNRDSDRNEGPNRRPTNQNIGQSTSQENNVDTSSILQPNVNIITNPIIDSNTNINPTINTNINTDPIITNTVTNQNLQPTNTPQNGVGINTISQSIIQNTQFTGLVLDHPVPTTFVQRETFQIRGRLQSPSGTGGAFVNLILRNRSTGQRINFSKFVIGGSSAFTISVDFSNIPSGQYFLTLFPGSSGTTQQSIYKVLPNSVDSKKSVSGPVPSTPTNFRLSIINNKFVLQWTQALNTPIEKLVFSQGSLRKEYILTNFHSSFQVPNKDFTQFQAATTVVELSSAYSSSLSLSGRTSNYSPAVSVQFQATTHHFDQDNPSQISYQSIPWRIEVGQSIVIQGTALQNLQNRIITQEPTKSFGSYYFNENNKRASIPVGTVLNKVITLNSPGVYILQVNNVGGGAVINRPVYVGNSYPLLPDFADLSPQVFRLQDVANAMPNNIVDQRNLLLNLLSQKRAEFGLGPLSIVPSLNQLGQAHSDDMVNRDFFGHTNPSGQGVGERATRLGITSSVGENIALNINITEAHLRLCRSPAHLENMVNQDWQRVGFGVARNSQQYFYVTQIFSGRDLQTNPLTDADYLVYKNQILSYIFNNFNFIQSQNAALSIVMSQWQNFSVAQQSATPLQTHLRNNNYFRYALGNVRVFFTPDFMSILEGTNYLTPQGTNFSQVGVSVILVDGWLQIYVAYT